MRRRLGWFFVVGGGGGERQYRIPTGGLFGLAACPHYLFEIVGFFGFAMIAQTAHALAVASGTAAYLAGRSCATRRWYESKFEDFPDSIKALVPYILSIFFILMKIYVK